VHPPQVMGPPVLVIARAGSVGQAAGRALACAALDCCHLGNAQVRALTASVAVPAVARPRPQNSSAPGELPESVS
jgi:hypothetical protein